MPALEIRVTVPFGDAGTVALAIEITDLTQLTAEQRQALADTGQDFLDLATATLAPPSITGPDLVLPAAQVHDPNTAVLGGVTGSRANKT